MVYIAVGFLVKTSSKLLSLEHDVLKGEKGDKTSKGA